MPLLRLFLKPGIDKQNTEYGAEGGWVDGDYIRFRYGLPEKTGGWQWFNDGPEYLVGMTSEVFTWNALDGTPYAVTGEKDASNEDGSPKYQQMDVASLVPLLIAEIQSLRARVAQLEGA